MTEEQAKTKWCPFAREITLDADPSPAPLKPDMGPFNIINHQYGPKDSDAEQVYRSKCIGSACMAWREEKSFIEKKRATVFEKPSGHYERTNQGYCGLAGKP